MAKKSLEFATSNEEKMKALGILLSTFIKEGIEFSLSQDGYYICLTIGGFWDDPKRNRWDQWSR